MQSVEARTKVETHTYRDRDGWHAKSEINVSATRVLKLTTSKVISGTGLRTSATVWNADGGGTLRHAMAFGGPSGDYSATAALSKPGRVTEAVVTAQHQAVLAQLSTVLVAIEQHYAKGRTASETVAAELDKTSATPV
jgi:hypothetical protein